MRVKTARFALVALTLGALTVFGAAPAGAPSAVQNLQDAPTEDYVRLIDGCERFAAAARDACYEWLGKTLAVLTDGEFGKTGCPELRSDAARRASEAGASRIDEPLVTFS